MVGVTEWRRLMSPAAKIRLVDGWRRVGRGAQWTRPQRARYTINTIHSDNKINDSKRTTAVGSWNNAHISRASYVDSGKPASKITTLASSLTDQPFPILPASRLRKISLASVECNQTSSASLNRVQQKYKPLQRRTHCIQYRFKQLSIIYMFANIRSNTQLRIIGGIVLEIRTKARLPRINRVSSESPGCLNWVKIIFIIIITDYSVSET